MEPRRKNIGSLLRPVSPDSPIKARETVVWGQRGIDRLAVPIRLSLPDSRQDRLRDPLRQRFMESGVRQLKDNFLELPCDVGPWRCLLFLRWPRPTLLRPWRSADVPGSVAARSRHGLVSRSPALGLSPTQNEPARRGSSQSAVRGRAVP